MVPVKEDEVLLPRNDEEGVNELGNLAEDEELHPQPNGAVAKIDLGGGAQVLLKGLRGEVVEQVWDSPEHPHEGECREEEIPVSEGHLQVVCRAVLHPLLSEVAECHVSDHKGNRDDRVIRGKLLPGESIIGFLEGSVKGRKNGVVLEQLCERLAYSASLFVRLSREKVPGATAHHDTCHIFKITRGELQ